MDTAYATPETLAEPETKTPAILMLPPDLLTTYEDPSTDRAGFAARFLEFLEMPVMRHYDSKFLDGALALANSVRKAIGLKPAEELKPGHRGSPSSCVIAATILDGYDGSKGNVAVCGSATLIGNTEYRHPKAVASFIHQFDGGAFNDLAK